MENTKQELPILYRIGKDQEVLQWRCWAEGDLLCTEHGQVDGKLQKSSKKILPKNEGKKNATTGPQQAQKEAEALHKKKLDRKYRLTVEDALKGNILPMLAKDPKKYKHKKKFPGFAQPKLDGCRATARVEDGEIIFSSRDGKEWKYVQHLKTQLASLDFTEGQVLDGELYLHDVTFQEVTRRLKSEKPENSTIEFWIYDMPESLEHATAVGFETRLKNLMSFFAMQTEGKAPNVKLVSTVLVNSEEELKTFHDKCVSEGYEGAIFREIGPEYPYLYGHRGDGLWKIKEFEDAEFKVVGHKEGEGRLEGTVIWICAQEEGHTFEVTPEGTLEERAELFKNAQRFYGLPLTVKFFGRSEKNIPRFPTGKDFRIEQDLS